MAIMRRRSEEYPEPELIALEKHDELTRRHLTRLRFYYQTRYRHAGHQDALDLDLIRIGALNHLEADPNGFTNSVQITTYGVHLLAQETEKIRHQRSPHNDLASRLAQHLQRSGRLTWENIEFKVGEGECHQVVRPDVFSVVTTLNPEKIAPTVYEVKVSRQDFLSDISKPKKREGYWGIAKYLYYVCPTGLIRKSEIPEGCGLMYEEADGAWRIAKRPRKQQVGLKPRHWMNLLLKKK